MAKSKLVKVVSADRDGGIGPHRHRWKEAGVMRGQNGSVVSFTCAVKKNGKKCTAHFERQMTKREDRVADGLLFPVWPLKKDDPHNCHVVWHDFMKRFYRGGGHDWRWTGWDLMKRIAKWAEGKPEVTLVRVDDDHHMNSDLVIIDNRAKEEYHGTTVVFIPQTGFPPSVFFLYPRARHALITALKAIDVPAKASMRRQSLRAARVRRVWKAVVQLPSSDWEASSAA